MSNSNELAALLGPFWSADHTQQRLAITLQAVEDRVKAGTLLGLRTSDGDTVFPVWQFTPDPTHDNHVDVRTALIPLLQALRTFDPWTVAVLLHTPAPELDEHTPLDWALDNRSTQALADLGRTVAREWSSGRTQAN